MYCSIHHLSDFLPRWKGIDGQLGRVEFRNILSHLSLAMSNEEYNKLWSRYDPEGKGFVTGMALMQHMGISINNPIQRPGTVSSVLSGELQYIMMPT